MKFYGTFILSCFCFLLCHAQFQYKAEIPVVEESGYYHLLISPEVSAVSNDDFSDIRIKNADGNETPYLLRSEDARKQKSFFEYYKLKENAFVQKVGVTHIVVENEKKENINQFCIIISNSDIRKYISLKGSNDNKNWYVVKQKTPAPMAAPTSNNTEMIVFDFPEGNYLYYQIEISNPEKLPVLVHQIGKYKYSEILGKYSEIPCGKFVKKDSTDKKTYISFPDLKMNYRIDKLSFFIDKTKDFYRNAWILGDNNYSVAQFTLSSQSENVIEMADFRMQSQTVILIENKDNPPLLFLDIKAFQLNQYLCVYLEKGTSYSLFCGDKKLSQPQYDMAYFQKNIPQNLPLLKLKTFENISSQSLDSPRQKAFYETQEFLWIIIVLVGLFLVWICWKMIRKM